VVYDQKAQQVRQQTFVYLFSDLLVFAKKTSDKLKHHKSLPLSSVILVDDLLDKVTKDKESFSRLLQKSGGK
jgi:hypothetical protein